MIRVEVVETSILRTGEKLRFAVAVEINRGRAAGMARHVATGEVASRTGEFMVVFAKAGVIRSPIVSLTVTLRPTLRTKGIRVRQVWSCVRRPRPPTIDAEETIPAFAMCPQRGKKRNLQSRRRRPGRNQGVVEGTPRPAQGVRCLVRGTKAEVAIIV